MYLDLTALRNRVDNFGSMTLRCQKLAQSTASLHVYDTLLTYTGIIMLTPTENDNQHN